MTATGVLLLVWGSMLLLFFGEPFKVGLSCIEWLAGFCLITGALFFTAGIVTWLWVVAP